MTLNSVIAFATVNSISQFILPQYFRISIDYSIMVTGEYRVISAKVGHLTVYVPL